MLKHQKHFIGLVDQIDSGELLCQDLNVALESLSHAYDVELAYHMGDLSVLPQVGMESVSGELNASQAERAVAFIKELVDKAIALVKAAFKKVVEWLQDRSAAVQRRIASAKVKLKDLFDADLTLTSAKPIEVLALKRLLAGPISDHLNTDDLHAMLGLMGEMVQSILDGRGEAIEPTLVRYDRLAYHWLVGINEGSGAVGMRRSRTMAGLIVNYLDDAPTPNETFEIILNKQQVGGTHRIAVRDALRRVEEIEKALKKFTADIPEPRRLSDKLMSKLAAIREIETEERKEQIRAFMRLITRGTGVMSSGYQFQVRVADAAVDVINAALKD